MRTAAFFGCVLMADFLAVVFQERLPPIPNLFGATVLIFPVFLAYGALSLPFALTLALAFFNGLLWDALTVLFLKPTEAFAGDAPVVPELTMGWSVLLFGAPRALGITLPCQRVLHERDSRRPVPHDHLQAPRADLPTRPVGAGAGAGVLCDDDGDSGVLPIPAAGGGARLHRACVPDQSEDVIALAPGRL